jgi:hypothetical protein
MSKRAEMRGRRQRQDRFQLIFLGVLAVVVVGTIGYLVYSGIQSGGLVGGGAAGGYDAGKAMGPANSKVVVQEFSDFQ